MNDQAVSERPDRQVLAACHAARPPEPGDGSDDSGRPACWGENSDFPASRVAHTTPAYLAASG